MRIEELDYFAMVPYDLAYATKLGDDSLHVEGKEPITLTASTVAHWRGDSVQLHLQALSEDDRSYFVFSGVCTEGYICVLAAGEVTL